LKQRNGTIVRSVDCVDGIVRNAGILGDRQIGDPFRIAKLNSNDVLKNLSESLCPGNIAGQVE